VLLSVVVLPSMATAAGGGITSDWPAVRVLPVAPGHPALSHGAGPPDSLAIPPLPRPELPDTLPFHAGERLEFSIDYGFINAGHATMGVEPLRTIAGVRCLELWTDARSNAFFSTIYKVWDRSQSFLEPEEFVSWRYEKHQREGSYRNDQLIKFDRRENFARYDDGVEVSLPRFVQDELAAFYYFRTLQMEVGQKVLIDSHANRKNYALEVRVLRVETVEVPAGEYECIVIEPMIREGGIFSAKGRLTIWLTNDSRRMPVRMSTKIAVGSVTASLTDYRLSTHGEWHRGGEEAHGSREEAW
jgi:hypothetical protein